MRDPQRIDRMLEKLAQIWKENPDQRLGQLIWNLIHPGDVFYREDYLLEGTLDKVLSDGLANLWVEMKESSNIQSMPDPRKK